MQKILNILFFVMSAISYGQVTVLTDVNIKEPKQNEPVVLTIVQEVVGENMEQQSPLRLPDLSKFDIVGSASEQNTFIDQKVVPQSHVIQLLSQHFQTLVYFLQHF